MRQIHQGLGAMASPADLAAAVTRPGRAEREFTENEHAAEIQIGGVQGPQSLERACASAGATKMQTLAAVSAATDDGTPPGEHAREPRFVHTGEHCDDEPRIALVHALAQRLADQMRVLVADARAGDADVPLTVHPALLASFALEALTQPVDASETITRRIVRLRQIAHALRGSADILEELTTRI